MNTEKKAWYRQLHWQVLVSLVAGTAFGVFAPTAAEGVGFLGDLFLRLLKMVIIPLIFTSLVDGVASLGDARSIGRVGFRTMVYYTFSTTAAIVVGMTAVNIIRPGQGLELAGTTDLPEGFATTGQSLPEFLIRMVPDNVFGAMAEGQILPVITFALLFGLFLSQMNGEGPAAVLRVVRGVLEVIQALTLGVVKLAPIGIFALLAREVARSGVAIFSELGLYFLTVGLGLSFHALVTLPLVLFFVGRRSPFAYFRAGSPALATAFSTASSSATLPLSMECSEEAGNRRGVTSFVLPLGATVNMDGTALYEAVAALTIAQMYGVELGLAQQALVLLTALLASVGAAGIPMAGLVMLVVVLQAVGLPLEGIGTIIAIDRVLDMMRTATNVWSDLVGTAIVNRFEGGSS
ncbi:MAG: dicarboxylate/amino acid:cation symporter [Acidobacteria bacterium]|nr:dicarboxylate/amino acid:cation symporter [Acidobacteriota bacterium]